MPWEQVVGRFAEQLVFGARSTVLKALLSIDGFLLFAIVTSAAGKVGAPVWLPVFLAVCFSMSFIMTLAAYGYFAVRDPDMLRSEHYSLQKRAIEKGLLGDNLQGLSPRVIGRGVRPTEVARIESESSTERQDESQ